MPGSSTHYLHQIPRIRDGLDDLLARDPVFRAMELAPESLPWRYMEPGFSGLVRIVIGQQISTHVARVLWEKFQAALPVVSPNAVLVLNDDDMRRLGLSSQKARYIRGLAAAVKDGSFDPDALAALEDAEIAARITALNGFGRWSAEMYLMFALARPDVWPVGDLGIREGLRRYLKLEDRPDEARAKREGERFAPHRTAASILLWHMASLK